MKKLTEYQPLTIEQRGKIMGIISMETINKGGHYDMAYMTAKTYLIELESISQKHGWPVWTVFEMRQKFERSDDLSKPLLQ